MVASDAQFQAERERVARDLRESASRDPHGSAHRDAHRLRNGLIWTLILAVLVIGIGIAIPNLRVVFERAVDADLWWIALAFGLEILSELGYVAIVRVVLRRGPAREVRWLAWAELAFGAVVPVGGAGGLAVGAWAMRAWGVPWSRIASRSAVIFLVTSAVNGAVLVLSGLGVWLGIGSAAHRSGMLYGLLPAAGGLAAMGAFCALMLVRPPADGRQPGKVRSWAMGIGSWVRDSFRVVAEGDWRLLGAIGYLLFDMATLWACMRAVGYSAPVLALALGYQIGYLSNLIPVPGGIGVVDGGLIGAMVLYGLPAAPVAAAVVLYHAVGLWVPAIWGSYSFVRLRRAVAEGPPALAPAGGAGDGAGDGDAPDRGTRGALAN